MKEYKQYLQDFWTNRRRTNLHENLDILKGPSLSELLDVFSKSCYSPDGNFELTIFDGANGEFPALCSLYGIEKLATGESLSDLILKIKFTMVREKKDGKLHRKNYEYSIFDKAEIIHAETIYFTKLERGSVEIIQQK